MEGSTDIIAIFLLPVFALIALLIFRRSCDDTVSLQNYEAHVNHAGAAWGRYAPSAPPIDDKIKLE